MQKKILEYKERSSIFEAVVFSQASERPKPAVVIFHPWAGRDDFAEKKAEQIAKLGYVGIALDMYGKDLKGETNQECLELMSPLVEDRLLLRSRAIAGYEFAKSLKEVDAKMIGAIGFCFGGLCALDLARSGADIKGVVSFHGLLNKPENLHTNIKSKILALHGHDDPMVSSKDLEAFQNEMTESKVDWQLHVYGGTMHAFTNPKANDPGFGTVYSHRADVRSWEIMKAFFQEIFEV